MAKLCEALEAGTVDPGFSILSQMDEEFVSVRAALAEELGLAS